MEIKMGTVFGVVCVGALSLVVCTLAIRGGARAGYRYYQHTNTAK